MSIKIATTLVSLSLVTSFSVLAETSTTFKLGTEMWWADTKVNEVNRDSDSAPSFYAAIEHGIKYVPDARLRYSSIDADYMAFDKVDLTLYYRVFEHRMMTFDAGITISDLSNTRYVNADNPTVSSEFDETIWAWYGYAEIVVPNTNIDVIGEMNFGDSSGIKSTDLMAGLQYRLPFEKSLLAFRGGYRVIDLESEAFKVGSDSDLGKDFIFANGWFVGAEFSF